MTKTLALTTALAIAAILALAETGSAAKTACKAGVTTFAGAPARVFCGPATAKLRLGDRTLAFHNGSCDRTSNYLTVNLGEIVLGTPSKPKPQYFGLTVGRLPFGGKPAARDGVYAGAAISAVHSARSIALGRAHVSLAGGRTHGTFTGQLVGSGKSVTGSFEC
jgi:hypothetical protein